MIRNISIHKFFEKRNINGVGYDVYQTEHGCTDETKTYCIVSEPDRKFMVDESEKTSTTV